MIPYLGIDEKSFLKGHRYATILTDTENKCVIDVTENRDAESAGKVFNSLNKIQLRKVKAISMDFWRPYIGGALDKLQNAEIAHDKFHIMKKMNAAIDAVRAKEHRQNKRGKDVTLTGTKYLWLKNPVHFNKKDKEKWAE